jgi:hypothetical protein
VGWQIQHVGHYVYIRDPANGGIFLLIDQSDQPSRRGEGIQHSRSGRRVSGLL